MSFTVMLRNKSCRERVWGLFSLLRDWLDISLFVAGWVAAFAPLDFFLSSFLHL